MNVEDHSIVKNISSLVNPWFLFMGFLSYALGAGIIHYLGKSIDWGVYLLGQGFFSLMQISGLLLKAYMEHPYRLKGLKTSGLKFANRKAIKPSSYLIISLACLTAGVVIVVLLLSQNKLDVSAGLFCLLIFILMYFYAMPPLEYANKGFGELARAFLISSIAPGLALTLQLGGLHRLILLLALPILFLYLAAEIAFSFPDYSSDLKTGKSLVTRIGWQRGMQWHNLLIIGGYLLIGVATIIGLPWALCWPGLVPLPFAVYMILEMIRIENGAKPRWKPLKFSAYILQGLTVYAFVLALWAR
jgi:1,4-dihydroxy-2-naphthoate octaprenyltransferase